VQGRGDLGPGLARRPSLRARRPVSRRPGQRVSPRYIGRHLVAAGVCLVVLTPLAYAKPRLGWRMASWALQGHGVLSGIGAASSLLALTALVLYDTLGWWQADRIRRPDRRGHRGRRSVAHRTTPQSRHLRHDSPCAAPSLVRSGLRSTILPPVCPPRHLTAIRGRQRGQTKCLVKRLRSGSCPTATGLPFVSRRPTPPLTWDFTHELSCRPSPSPGRGLRTDKRKSRLTCGAPLRNRTVDLLLTMETLCRLS
jgi:hypothetical protein